MTNLKERLKLKTDPVFLFDGKQFIYRAYHAYPNLKRSDGFPTNAIFIIARLILKIFREERPRFGAFIIDGKGKNFRHELFVEYKAGRAAMPEPLIAQLEPIERFMRLAGLKVFTTSGFEADDYLASAADYFKRSAPVILTGSDKDLRQCLDDDVYIWDPAQKKELLLTVRDFREKTGLEPSQWPDFQALTGDPGDNIPGIEGIGPKSAAKLLTKFPTLEDIKQNINRLGPTDRKKIEPDMEKAFLYRELTRLKLGVFPVRSLDDLAIARADVAGLRDFLKSYEFRSLAGEVDEIFSEKDRTGNIGITGTPPLKPEAKDKPGQPSSKVPSGARPARLLLEFARDKEEKPESSETGTSPASAPSPGMQLDLLSFARARERKLAEKPLEKTAIEITSGSDVGLVREDDGFFAAVTGQRTCFIRTVNLTSEDLNRAGRIFVYDLKKLLCDCPLIARCDMNLFFDLGVAAWIIDPEGRDYSRGRLIAIYGLDTIAGGETDAASAAATDDPAAKALAIGQKLSAGLCESGLDRLATKLEFPLIPLLREIEAAGISIDKDAFAEFSNEIKTMLEISERRLEDMAGTSFNPRSSRQLSEVLFGRLKLKSGGKTPGGVASTSVEVLEKMKGAHPIIDEILNYRHFEKLRSTYLEPLPLLAGPDGRLRTTLNQTATATGRLSSSAPNLQNIPIKGEYGRRMRSCFTAASGKMLISADYSQIELRILAHFSEDNTLLDAFRNNEDVHAMTAAILFGKDRQGISKDERRKAKTINFGLLYGMGPQKLGRELGIPMKEAKKFIEAYFSGLTGLKSFYAQVVEETRERGFVETLAGRRRYLPEIHSRNNMLFEAASRQAINTRIQGSAADIIKMAMIEAGKDPYFRDVGAAMILQIHDELLMEASPETAGEVGKRLSQIMSGVCELKVPLVVDMGIGSNWADAH